MVKRSAWLPAALAAMALLPGCSGGSEPSRRTSRPLIPADERVTAPALAGTTLEGQSLDVADFRGKVVVVNFWASWCPPCRAETPSLVQVASETHALGVQFVGINVKNDRTAARRFDAVHGVPYPSLYDQPGILLTRFRKFIPPSPPTTLILDRQGRVASLLIGGVTRDELLASVESVATERA